ncbi:DUF4272 domain-containing protein [Shewanella sp.]|uniref:DUF4272 domain-containing protein n=1 Tax=Shewanella sp. TaxID=50422 RepID=UPI003A96A62D
MEVTEEPIKVRTVDEVAARVLGLIATIGKVHFAEQNQQWLQQHNIARYLTADEQAFINSEEPEHQQLVEFSWKAEALASLVWSLNGLISLQPFNEQFAPFSNEMVQKAINHPELFLAEAQLRSEDELVQMEAYLYHQHWRVRDRDYGFHNDKPDADDPNIDELDSGIVYERRYGMSWGVGDGEDWDNVPTDT